MSAPHTHPNTDPFPQYKSPCGASPTLTFVQVSNTSNWAGKPNKSARLKSSQSCVDMCTAAANGRTGCAAYAISTQKAATYCDLYYSAVPPLLCEAAGGSKLTPCKRGSQGAFRAKWAYGG